MEQKKKLKKSFHRLFLVCLFFLGTTAVGTAQVDGNTTVDFPAEEQMMQTAKETVQAYETGNWEVLRNHVAEDAIFYNLGSYDSLSVDQVIKYWTVGREKATPVLADDGVWLPVAVSEGPREGKWILHWGNNTLSYPNGETISFPYHVAMKFRDDKVSQVHFYYDNNRIIRAMGYEIQPPFVEEEEDIDSEEEDGIN